MKIIKIVYIALIYSLVSLGLSQGELMAQSKRKRTGRTVNATQKAQTRSRTQRTQKKTKTNRATRRAKAQASQPTRTINFQTVRHERRQLDSLRLHNGGTEPIAPRIELLPVDIEPLMTRFRRGDTTLTSEVIAQLYYSNHAKRGEGSFLHQMETETDRSISSSRYAEALRTARRGLLRNPMYFALIKRACDLAQHEGDPEVDTYLWQIVELFTVVECSGNGKSPETAYEVMGVSDAILFETLWLETPKTQIKRREPVLEERGKQLLILEINSGGNTSLRYYRVPTQI